MSGLLCRASGPDDDYSQLCVEDGTGIFLSTKIGSVVDLAQNRSYVILDLGCTKSAGSRYAINKFMTTSHIYGLVYELIPLTSMFAFADSETKYVSPGITNLVPHKATHVYIVVIVEQGRVPIFFALQQTKRTYICSWTCVLIVF